ncbi:unnamed protein product [Allacma fusca]|uniref:Uncharacterized protein n=1 Tax=Allacma fusca TaxID=39272 RepID=A0A8J2J036_9HEXA|nr:unnamed protein product [Allacma fusca]
MTELFILSFDLIPFIASVIFNTQDDARPVKRSSHLKTTGTRLNEPRRAQSHSTYTRGHISTPEVYLGGRSLKSHLSLDGSINNNSSAKLSTAIQPSKKEKMSTLIIILRPSLAIPNMWKIQIDGLHEDQMAKLTKKIEHVKFKREYVSNLISIRWRIETNKLMPMTHIAPLVNVFETWGYKLLSCEKGVDYESDIIFWTLVREDQVKSRKIRRNKQ